MKRFAILAVGMMFLGIGPARGEWPGWCWWKKWYSPDCHAPGCCGNDYCPKKLPSAMPVPRGGPNDYCPKKLPSAPPAPVGNGHDYCAKSLPPIFPLVPGPWHTCGPMSIPFSDTSEKRCGENASPKRR